MRTIFEYPPEIRKAIYTTNAIESLNSVIRAATKRRKVFPSDDSARKVVYLAIEQASRKCTMPIQNWKMALNRFVIEFGDRITDHQWLLRQHLHRIIYSLHLPINLGSEPVTGVVARTDPNEQESLILLPELEEAANLAIEKLKQNLQK